MKSGTTYFSRTGFSINEGFGPANIHVSWLEWSYWFYLYIYFFGIRLTLMIDKTIASGRIK